MGACCAASQSKAIVPAPFGEHSFSRRPRDGATERAVGKFNSGKQVLALDDLGFDGDAEARARFLHSTSGLDTYAVGDLLGDPKQEDLMNAYVQELEFEDLTLDAALRRLLRGFRLPGEAQKIDRLMCAFARHFCACQSPGALNLEEDAAYVVSFALIMLNTDLHNPSNKRRMNLLQFQSNLRGLNSGEDFPASWTSELYQNIKKNELVLDNRFTKHCKSIDLKASTLRKTLSGKRLRRKSAAIVPDLKLASLTKLKSSYDLQRLKLHERSRASSEVSLSSASGATSYGLAASDGLVSDHAEKPGMDPEDQKQRDVLLCQLISADVMAETEAAELELIPSASETTPSLRGLHQPVEAFPATRLPNAQLLPRIATGSDLKSTCMHDSASFGAPPQLIGWGDTACTANLAGPFFCCACPCWASGHEPAQM